MKKLALLLCFVLFLTCAVNLGVLADTVALEKEIKVLDPGFENMGENADWALSGRAEITDKYAHGGKYSLALPNTDDGNDADAAQTLTGFVKGATYEISAWLLNPEETTMDIGYWLYFSSKDYYDWADTGSQLGIEKGTTRWQLGNNGHFQRFAGQFSVPEGTKSVMLDIRHRLSPGTLYVDDVEIKMVKEPLAIDAETDEVFYYTEWEKGYLTGVPNLLENAEGAKAEVTLLSPEGATIHNESFSDLSKGFTYTFRTAWMTEKGKRYHIGLKVYGADGALIQEQQFPVFRFDRPTYLGADGIFRKNGKEYTYQLGAGVSEAYLDYHPEDAGFTVIQLISPPGSRPFKERMDKAYEQGLLCLINLYYMGDCAGSDNMIENTIKVVNEVKDHPALFGYKIQDEPYQKGNTDEEMIRAYELVRNLDPHHPVYSGDSVTGGLEWLFRYCDVMDTAYFLGANKDAGRVTSEAMDIAMKASKGRKPFSTTQQAFPMGGYLPNVDELRHMIYQGFFSGGVGCEFHSLGIDATDGNNTVYMTRPEFRDLVEKWAPWERDFMYGCFVTGEYTFLNYEKTKDVMWATFTDGKEVYAICLNREKSLPMTAEIPLVDGANTVSVADYTATRMTGKEETITGKDKLSLTLEPWEAVVFKVTPSIAVDFSHLKNSKFNDVMPYPWAVNAIATLEEKGIVNKVSDTWFGPGQNITRADYAMFLVRTLGLTGSGENFADVDPAAEYAKELAIGKANGVINGIGDNKFNPEAEITRQDMMTMTSRALKLAGAADLSAFSDASGIADYAQSHVAAMVAEGLIKGNADGTINPRGNTTRAEAAVIMQRIINK
ncbi:MAG: S-layer homology domain-containing protein [Clostridia bacterium]|nr:S-layer homology domain-containing protein [Clostridia bacterium]